MMPAQRLTGFSSALLALALLTGSGGSAFAQAAPTERPALPDGAAAPVPAARPDEPADAGVTPGGTDAQPVGQNGEGNEAPRDGTAAAGEGAQPGSKPDASGETESLPAAQGQTASPEDGAVPVPEPRPESPGAAGEAGASGDAAKPGDGQPAPPQPTLPEPAAGTAAPSPSVPESKSTGDLAAPRPTTESLKAATEEVTPESAVDAAAAIKDAKLCEAELTRRGVKFSVGESISEGDCGVLRPVKIEALSSGVTIPGGTVILCRTALALDEWVGGTVAGAAKAEWPDAKLKTIEDSSTYVCRPRAGEGKISEHARGSAIDIGAFGLADGRSLPVKPEASGTAEARFADGIRAAACGPFKTVLGPGTDAAHKNHLHLDMAARRGGATYCK
ncbi:extensin family protein [Mangrovicella endophytica]|uniref:extensin family protein n=1 Tax=Mangrovicella endophytica TaxID=2066697 RepID=UPI000C9DE2CB|nr:extensin family protein [Mangrovicella endophytica]